MAKIKITKQELRKMENIIVNNSMFFVRLLKINYFIPINIVFNLYNYLFI
jgi:hypothetical protein